MPKNAQTGNPSIVVAGALVVVGVASPSGPAQPQGGGGGVGAGAAGGNGAAGTERARAGIGGCHGTRASAVDVGAASTEKPARRRLVAAKARRRRMGSTE